MRSILSRNLSIVGGVVGVLLVSSAIGAVASSRHSDGHVRIELASTPAVQQNAPAPTVRSEAAENEAAENEAAENEAAENEAAENEAAENEAAENEAAENEAAENEPAKNEPAEKEPAENEQPAPPAPPAPVGTPASSTRTFSLVGGTVAVACTGNVISISSVTPNAGFTTESEQNDGGQAEVRFRSDSHESRLEVSCQNGTIVVNELREEES
jgi:flagellar biosynthesis GTPase FlhF